MNIVEGFEHSVAVLEQDVWIPLSCGHRLAARIWLPENAHSTPVPALLEYLPYRKRDMTRNRDEPTHHYLAGHGYASVRVDLRGAGDSYGIMDDEYTPQELDDGVEVIAWLSAQSWCSGRVGMFGISWGGFNALQIAAKNPPALKAIITSCSTDDRYTDDMHYAGGCLLNDHLDWATTFFCIRALPGDPLIMGEGWRENWMERLEAMSSPLSLWLEHQRRDDYWKHGSVNENYDAIECPVFAVGGWLDGYTSAIPRLLSHLRVPRLGLIGPHAHQWGHSERAPAPAIGFLQEALRWWDHWLKDDDRGIMEEPMLRVHMAQDVPATAWYERRPGHWVGENTWPSPRIESKTYTMNNRGTLSSAAAPQTEVTLRSAQLVGQAGGEWCPYGTGGEGPEFPDDQRADDGGSIVFDSEPVQQRTEILGQPIVTVMVEVDQPSAFLAIRLNDVKPDGSVSRVTYGVLNLCHRDGHESPKPLVPGERYRLSVPLHDIAYAFLPGHRIRVSVSTTYWPMIWPSPCSVTLNLLTGVSTLTLPIRPTHGGPEIKPFEPPEEGPPMPEEQLESQPSAITISKDVLSGRVEFLAKRGGGISRIKEHGGYFGRNTVERMSIIDGDPQSAETEMTVVSKLGRDDWTVEVTATQKLTADTHHFFLDANIEVQENGSTIFQRRWTPKIPRDHM